MQQRIFAIYTLINAIHSYEYELWLRSKSKISAIYLFMKWQAVAVSGRASQAENCAPLISCEKKARRQHAFMYIWVI